MEDKELEVEVILDIYSGRPNPTWTLTPEEITVFKEKFSKDAPATKPRILPQLGYKGMIIFNRKQVPGIPERVRVFNGAIMIEETKKLEDKETIYRKQFITHIEDVNNIEEMLFRQAQKKGYKEVINQARPARYLGNNNTMEVHDLDKQTKNCQIDEILEEHKVWFETFEAVEAALRHQGYNGCAWCMPKYHTG